MNKTGRINQSGVHQGEVCEHLPVQMPLRAGEILKSLRAADYKSMRERQTII
jgi:hypothetical protein